MYYYLLLIIPIVMYLIFYAVLRVNHGGMVSGFLFDAFLLSFAGALMVIAVRSENNPVVYLLLITTALFTVAFLAFGIYILIAFLFVNTVIIVKREKVRISHLLTLLLAIAIIIFLVILAINNRVNLPFWIKSMIYGLANVIYFFSMHIFIFLSSIYATNTFSTAKKADYIIVLGSGLIGGKVTPLLAGRIDRAINYANRQKKKLGALPYLVMSGGKGSDEPVSEASAMKAYAASKGFNTNFILTEENSANTRENFLFSKQLIEVHSKNKHFSCIFSTSSYHVFRAGLFAKKSGFPMDGLGSRTAAYYLPNAVLREYIAYLAIRKKKFTIIFAIIFILTFVLSVIQHSL